MIDPELDRAEASPPPYRLERPVSRRWVAGVAQGLAIHWGVPVWLLRLGFVLLTPVGGLGVVLYTLGWLFLPLQGSRDAVVAGWIDQLRDRQAWLGAALVAAGAIIVISSLNIVSPGLIWAGALLTLGVLLYRGDLGNLHSDHPPVPPVEDEPGTQALESPMPEPEYTASVSGPDYPIDPPPMTARVRPERPPAEPSYLGRLTLGAMLVTIGIMAAFDVSDITRPTSRHYFAAAILVIGVGLLVGAFVGRSRGLIVFGLLLTPLVLVASLADIRFDGEFGEIDVRATSTGDLESVYRLSGGYISLDLRKLELNGETVNIDARVAAGRVRVILPTEYRVEIDSEVRLGALDILGRSSDGFSRTRTTTRDGTGGTLNLVLEVGIGAVVVNDYGLGESMFVQEIRPTSLEELQPSYSMSEGNLHLDLSGLPPSVFNSDSPIGVEALVGRGELVVLVPPWMTANIGAQIGSGVLDLLGRTMVGQNLFDELNLGGNGDHLFEMYLRVDEGSITVVQP